MKFLRCSADIRLLHFFAHSGIPLISLTTHIGIELLALFHWIFNWFLVHVIEVLFVVAINYNPALWLLIHLVIDIIPKGAVSLEF